MPEYQRFLGNRKKKLLRYVPSWLHATFFFQDVAVNRATMLAPKGAVPYMYKASKYLHREKVHLTKEPVDSL